MNVRDRGQVHTCEPIQFGGTWHDSLTLFSQNFSLFRLELFLSPLFFELVCIRTCTCLLKWTSGYCFPAVYNAHFASIINTSTLI